MLRFTYCALLAGLVASGASAQTVLRVAQDPYTGPWEDVFPTIQDALDYAASNPALAPFDIWVATGTYRPDPSADLTLDPNDPDRVIAALFVANEIRLYGGFEGDEGDLTDVIPGAYPTTLSASLDVDPLVAQCTIPPGCGDPEAGSCFAVHGSPHCESEMCCELVCCVWQDCCTVEWDSTCVFLAFDLCQFAARHVVATVGAGLDRRLEGFTITDAGKSTAAGLPSYSNDAGGGIRVAANGLDDEVWLDVALCTVIANFADRGGGIAIATGPPSGSSDPEVARARVWNCEVVENAANTRGGGVHALGSARYDIVNSTIARNAFLPPTEINATGEGAALFEAVTRDGMSRSIVNCTLVGNIGTHPGVYQSSNYEDDLVISNSIIQFNLSVDTNGDPVQCLPGSDCVQVVGGAVVRYSNLGVDEELLGSYVSCINEDPLFVDVDGPSYDYTLSEQSPSIDTGENTIVQSAGDPLDVNHVDGTSDVAPDLALRDRIRRGGLAVCVPTVDMGAYEAQGACLLGDFDNDLDVDGADLGTLLAQWGPCSPPCVADLDCSGEVDGADLGTLLAQWPGFPRECGGSSAMATASLSGGESAFGAAEGAGISLSLLADLLGFASVEECVSWLVSLPFEEMAFFLDQLG